MKSCAPVLLVLLTLAGIPSVSGADAQPADSAENPLLETIELGRLLV